MVSRKEQAIPSIHEPLTTPPVDLLETPEHFLLLMELPGVAKEGLNIKVHEGILAVVGTPQQTGVSVDRLLYGEVKHGIFQRRFLLSDGLVDIERATAHLEDGVLSLTLPKQRKRRSRRIPVRELP
jgi:HSP20 family protein